MQPTTRLKCFVADAFSNQGVKQRIAHIFHQMDYVWQQPLHVSVEQVIDPPDGRPLDAAQVQVICTMRGLEVIKVLLGLKCQQRNMCSYSEHASVDWVVPADLIAAHFTTCATAVRAEMVSIRWVKAGHLHPSHPSKKV